LVGCHKDSKGPYQFISFSASFTSIAPKFSMKELPERSLFSSDAPFGYPMLVHMMVERASEDTEVTKMVLGGNISRLLNIK
jgi:predicted TIM-barrel fold metal-dependent hydrolase